jgi:ATP-binding cassette subfamily B protein
VRVGVGSDVAQATSQAFIQYSPQFTQPLTQFASMVNVLRSGIASAERVFELLDAEEQTNEESTGGSAGAARGRVEFRPRLIRLRPGSRPLIEELSIVAEPGRTVAIVGPTGRRQDDSGQPDHALLRARPWADPARRP